MNNLQMDLLPDAFIAEGNELYRPARTSLSATEIIEAAKALLSQRFRRIKFIANSEDAKDFFVTQLTGYDYEVFAVAFLDIKHRMIAFEPMFRGTINTASVWPRDVVKRALELNATRVILAHNHPSGVPEPSQADIEITRLLKESFKMFEIEVLDHIVVGGTQTTSFADSGLL